MPKYEFLVETIYEEIVEVEAESLEAAELLVQDGEGSQVDMVKAMSNIVTTREVDE